VGRAWPAPAVTLSFSPSPLRPARCALRTCLLDVWPKLFNCRALHGRHHLRRQPSRVIFISRHRCGRSVAVVSRYHDHVPVHATTNARSVVCARRTPDPDNLCDSLTLTLQHSPAGKMENDDGVAVDLYIPRKWCARAPRAYIVRVSVCARGHMSSRDRADCGFHSLRARAYGVRCRDAP
jgi:hypothetical protein